MPKIKLKLEQEFLLCSVCKHYWKQRGKRKPLVCPNRSCNSMRWDLHLSKEKLAKIKKKIELGEK